MGLVLSWRGPSGGRRPRIRGGRDDHGPHRTAPTILRGRRARCWQSVVSDLALHELQAMKDLHPLQRGLRTSPRPSSISISISTPTASCPSIVADCSGPASRHHPHRC
ncbi:hypothetical protein RHA1_ro03117 [Rhodococcus jostii RHA1]|uniref:Uncharacterized protein n=1 Tax=Rhodococcus jostii (strain RHA1) TaxID=101510 RepID=Q0SC16_RHOJR|nr:hypothetical protein RHA1_ro03117 [Rhodococcus jostii RHA1]